MPIRARPEPAVGLRVLLRIPTFLVLYVAETQSIAGDQLARVALAVLVYDRTSSSMATALTYAATFLPAVCGGLLLGGLGDHRDRRAVMIGTDLFRAGIFGLMGAVDLSTAALIVLVALAVLVGPAFSAAEVGDLASALTGEQFRSATGIRMITSQAAQVGGFLVGGVVVSTLRPRGALLVDGATYVISAGLIAVLARSRHGRTASTTPASTTPASTTPASTTPASDAVDGLPIGSTSGRGWLRAAYRPRDLGEFWRRPGVGGQLALISLAGFFVVPEGLAVPFGAQLRASTAVVGVLFAAIPLGTAVGTLALMRWARAPDRIRVAYAMALCCGLPLAVTPLSERWLVVAACWAVAGLLAAYQVELTSTLIRTVPDELRSSFIGVLTALLLGSQGVGLLVFGALAQVVAASTAIAAAGAVGVALAAYVVWRARRDL